MPTPCRLYRIFPRSYDIFHELFLEKNKVHVYQKLSWKIGEPEIPFKVYSEPLGADDIGIPCNLAIDTPVYIFNRDQGRVVVKSTQNTFFRTFNLKSDRLLGLFSSKDLSHRILGAFEQVLKDTEPDVGDLIIPMIINLKDKEAILHKEFSEVRRFWMKDMPDLYIRGAGISGVKLQDSPEYQRYVKKMGGKLMSIVFRWQGITILLSSDGLIFTYAEFPSYRESSIFFKTIIDKLIKVDALEYLL